MSTPVLDQLSHRYTLEGKPLVSVSKVIYSLIKKSFEGVDEAVLKNAAERGILVEKYATEWLQTGGVETPADERLDVLDRLECFGRWRDAVEPTMIEAQRLVWSDDAAGMLDFVLSIAGKRYIVDLKCTAQPEATWILQVGAYLKMHPDTSIDGGAVLHINPKYKQGYIWREYAKADAIAKWSAALEWYRILTQLKAEAA